MHYAHSISGSILAKQCYLLSLSETFSFDGKLFHFQPPSPPSVFGQGRTLRWCVSPAAGYCPLIRGSAILSLYCMPRISLVFVFGGNIFLHAQHLHLLSISRKPMFVEKSNFATRGFPVRQFTPSLFPKYWWNCGDESVKLKKGCLSSQSIQKSFPLLRGSVRQLDHPWLDEKNL